jgi:proteasome accessory factor A
VRERVFGLETEYAVTCTRDGERRLGTDEVARALFRHVVSWGRSSNVFLENGARLYLDVGSHPEYATPECRTPHEVVVHERAGDRIVQALADRTQATFDDEGIDGRIRVFRNNTDFAGNSYGSHENYLVARVERFAELTDALLPFLVTRQVFAGAGKVLTTARGARYVLSQRAEHMWETVSSATTRSRPIINSRDEPHADAERFRRLHVIVGDSNMSDYTTWLRVATCDLVLRLLEARPAAVSLHLESATRAIREVSHHLDGTGPVRMIDGRELTALQVQATYLEATARFIEAEHPDDADAQHVLREWQHVLETLADDPMRLGRRLDWVAKLQLIEAYRTRHDVELDDPTVAMLDLSYHDTSPRTGLHHLLVRQGRMDRITTDDEVALAEHTAPPRTRAALRGRFIAAARAADVDHTVDWVHLRVNGELPQTVMCKDPLVWEDAAVDRLIARMAAGAPAAGAG